MINLRLLEWFVNKIWMENHGTTIIQAASPAPDILRRRCPPWRSPWPEAQGAYRWSLWGFQRSCSPHPYLQRPSRMRHSCRPSEGNSCAWQRSMEPENRIFTGYFITFRVCWQQIDNNFCFEEHRIILLCSNIWVCRKRHLNNRMSFCLGKCSKKL